MEKIAIVFLRKNLIVVIPFTVLGLRVLVRWVVREQTKDIFRSALNVPLDLMFIAISLLLTGLARMNPQFAARYESDTEADLAGIILFAILITLAVIMTYLHRWIGTLWQKFFAAWQQVLRRKEEQLEFQWKDADLAIAGRLLWMTGYWVAMVLLLSVDLLMAVGSLWYILGHLE